MGLQGQGQGRRRSLGRGSKNIFSLQIDLFQFYGLWLHRLRSQGPPWVVFVCKGNCMIEKCLSRFIITLFTFLTTNTLGIFHKEKYPQKNTHSLNSASNTFTLSFLRSRESKRKQPYWAFCLFVCSRRPERRMKPHDPCWPEGGFVLPDIQKVSSSF